MSSPIDNDNNNRGQGGGGIRLIDTAAAAGNANAETQQQNDNAETTATNATTTVGSTTVTGLPLDWTQMNSGADSAPPVRYPTDVSPGNQLDVTDGELVLVGTAGQKITNMGQDLSALLIKACEEQAVEDGAMKKIILRSHLIRDMQGLDGLPAGSLELLELYDNQVQALVLTPNLSSSLRVLDMSYNAIRDMAPVANCPNLQELYLANNKLKAIAGLSGLSQLRKLDLGANRIRVMPAEELSGLQQIEELWLGKNKIEKVQGLSQLSKLRRLDLQSNRLEELPRDQFVTIAPTLEELYLAHNGLTTVGGGGWLDADDKGKKLEFPELMVLDLSRNQLKSANELGSAAAFPLLEELWVSGNQIAEWSAVQELKALTALETVYLEYNPIQTTDPLYRKSLAQLIPQLKQIDATLISAAPSMLGTSGLVRGAGTPVESEQDRLRRFQEMALQRAEQESRAKEEKADSDDSGAENDKEGGSGKHEEPS